jgi:hypothetical protein
VPSSRRQTNSNLKVIMFQLGCFPEALQRHVWSQVQQLHCSQTQPFETIVADYMSCMQRNRELEVIDVILGQVEAPSGCCCDAVVGSGGSAAATVAQEQQQQQKR